MSEQMHVTSRASARLKRGRMDGSERAKSVLPLPGGPAISTL